MRPFDQEGTTSRGLRKARSILPDWKDPGMSVVSMDTVASVSRFNFSERWLSRSSFSACNSPERAVDSSTSMTFSKLSSLPEAKSKFFLYRIHRRKEEKTEPQRLGCRFS